jgi:hypothetical protein
MDTIVSKYFHYEHHRQYEYTINKRDIYNEYTIYDIKSFVSYCKNCKKFFAYRLGHVTSYNCTHCCASYVLHGCVKCNAYKLHKTKDHKLPYIPIYLLLLSLYDKGSMLSIYLRIEDIIKIIIKKYIELRNGELKMSVDSRLFNSDYYYINLLN